MRVHVLSLAFAICGQVAMAEAPKVVTDIAPVYALVTTVMGERGTPELLLPAGGDPHNFQLRPSQARLLADAGLIVWVGDALSPWMERGLEGVGSKGARLELLEAEGTLTREFSDTAEDHGHGHEDGDKTHDHAAEDHAHDDHGHEGHSHEGLDPHAWLDPENGRIWLGVIAEALAKADPEGADIYRANAAAGRAEIDATEAEIRALLDPVKDRPFAVFHDAYGYFADHFGLNVAGAIRMGDAAQPGAAHVRAVQTDLQASGAVCVFPEANHNTDMASQMAEAAGIRMGGALDPAGTALPQNAGLYSALLTGLATTIADCLAKN